MSERYNFARDPSNDMLIGPDGCHYETEAEAFWYAVFEFCGCGCPTKTHEFALECLFAFDRTSGHWRDAMEAIEKVVTADPAAAAYFIAYALDKAGLTEHGGSVGASWLTPLGEQALEVGAHADALSVAPQQEGE